MGVHVRKLDRAPLAAKLGHQAADTMALPEQRVLVLGQREGRERCLVVAIVLEHLAALFEQRDALVGGGRAHMYGAKAKGRAMPSAGPPYVNTVLTRTAPG